MIDLSTTPRSRDGFTCLRALMGTDLPATVVGRCYTDASLRGTHKVMRLDLANLQSVREFVAAFTAKHDRLDGLACNAGIMNMRGDLEHTEDGSESTIAVIYFGHFLLTELLLDILRATAPS